MKAIGSEPLERAVPRTTGFDETATDAVFGLAVASLPVDYAPALWVAVRERLRWLDGDPCAGIYLSRTVTTDYGVVLLPRRAKLALRVSRARLSDALTLAGASLSIDTVEARVGAGVERPLRPCATLYSPQVTMGAADEPAFASDLLAALRAMRISCGSFTGRARRARSDSREIAGFSVLLHGLERQDSLRIQSEGLGGARAQGWGIFGPHKAVAAAT